MERKKLGDFVGAALALLLLLTVVAFAFEWGPPVTTASGANALGQDTRGDAPDGLSTSSPEKLIRTVAGVAPATGSLLLMVVYEGGEPADGVGVKLVRPGGELRVGVPRGTTNRHGSLLFERLPVGEWLMILDRARDDHLLTAVVAKEVTRARIVIPITLRVRGRVVDIKGRGVDLANIFVSPSTSLGQDASPVATTDAAGRFSMNLGFRPAMVGARASGYAPSAMHLVDGATGSWIEGLELLLPEVGGDLTGRVVDPRGAGVEGAVVRVGAGRTDLFQPVDGIAAAPPGQVMTLENGAFTVRGLPVGRHEVVVRALGYAPWTGGCAVEAGETSELRVELTLGSRVRGTVRSPEGKPIEGCDVAVFERGDLRGIETRTAADGAYLLEDLAPGEHVVSVRSRAYGRKKSQVSCKASEEVVLDIVLDPGVVLEGVVRSLDGRPVPDAILNVWVEEPEMRSLGTRGVTGDGTFVVPNMPPGPVNVRVEGYGIEQRDFRNVVPGEGRVVLEVRVKGDPTAVIEGVVLDPNDQPLASAKITLREQEHHGDVRIDQCLTRPGTGTFRLGPVPPGRYRVVVEAADYPRVMTDWRDVGSFEFADLGGIRMSRGGRIRVEFPNPSVEGLSVSLYDVQRRWVADMQGAGLSPALEPGVHIVRVHGPRTAERVTEVNVVSDQETVFRAAHETGYRCRLECVREAAEEFEEFSVEVAPEGRVGRVLQRFWMAGQTVFVDTRVLGEGAHVVRLESGSQKREKSFVVQRNDAVQVLRVELD